MIEEAAKTMAHKPARTASFDDNGGDPPRHQFLPSPQDDPPSGITPRAAAAAARARAKAMMPGPSKSASTSRDGSGRADKVGRNDRKIPCKFFANRDCTKGSNCNKFLS